ncbi:hypothetical protein TVAG_116160 [Trichomonas vaginalis G3]|uniref:Vps16 N-terminal domain-containing protein n=1 Tax=Trichomonas vaginalis (strain ATCC PRA-98 / G3) TaxID=412133 RepID=A2EXQ2_TRIV3|nr:vacuolar protein sorting VPSs16 family [Trichomonas vaginalis G3]EAY02562.1 hypothetical protein TVAG_116160 [Trichomonas vaginalis G3]KAI5552047.1 vacuolar protein sorting VPSs16 family [Trichomonas vaginalis G3]|eukprot:XP_001330698.1 hypothetical protein [Trichomonas vaginalis G3]
MYPWLEQLNTVQGTKLTNYRDPPFGYSPESSMFGYNCGLILSPRNTYKPAYQIYTNSCKEVFKTAYFDLDSPIVLSAFTSNSIIVFLLKNGTIAAYKPNGKQVYLRKELNFEVICASQNYLGIVYVLNNMNLQFFSFDRMEVTIDQQINDPPQYCVLQNIENGVFLFSSNGEVYFKTQQNLTSIFKVENEHITNIIAGINNPRIAIFTNKKIYIKQAYPSHKDIIEHQFDLVGKEGAWLNPNTLIASLNNGELCIFHNGVADFNPSCKVLKIFSDLNLVRLYSTEGLYIYYNPPASIESLNNEICKSVVRDFKNYESKNIDFIQNMNKNYVKAIPLFIQAARDSPLISTQMFYMSVASFLRSNYPNICANEFKSAIDFLRILNTLNSDQVGMCFTPEVLQNCSEQLFERLSNLQLYKICEYISDFLGVPHDKIAEEWVLNEIQTNGTKNLEEITQMLHKYSNINFHEVIQCCVDKKLSQYNIVTMVNSIKSPVQKIILLNPLYRTKARETALVSDDGCAIICYLLKDEEQNLQLDLRTPLLSINYFSFARYRVSQHLKRESKSVIIQSMERLIRSEETNKQFLEILTSSSFEKNEYGKNTNILLYIMNNMEMSKFGEYIGHQNYIITILGNLAPAGDTLSPRQFINACYANNKAEVAEKIAHKVNMSPPEVEYSRLRSVIKNKSNDMFDKLIREGFKHLQPDDVMNMILFYRCEDLATRYLNMLNMQQKTKLLDEALNYSYKIKDKRMIDAFENYKNMFMQRV